MAIRCFFIVLWGHNQHRIPDTGSAMGFKIAISLIYFLVICLSIETAHADCFDTGNFTADSTYSKNRDTIIASLPSNAAANGGFYNSTVGHGSDKVYATAMCRGDASESECSSCVNTTAHDLISECPLQYEAVSWAGDPLCVVHYANKYIFGVLEMSPRQAVYNTGTISWNSSGFYQTWTGLMEKVKNRAAAGSSTLKYAAAKTNLITFQYIYALVQCTPDLSEIDCDDCLTQNIADLTLFYGQQGGAINRPSCIYRWDLYLFYNESGNNAPPPSTPPPSLPASPPSPSGKGSTNTIIIVSVSVATFLILIICICIYLRTRKSKDESENEIQDIKALQYELSTIKVATNNFCDANKLGQGGFGVVYKGVLSSGQQIAVKRLIGNSMHGDGAFKSEVSLVAKLQHRNLVMLLGFCLDLSERLLVFEFVPNSSLDHYIFDQIKREAMDWGMRYKIITGIARGLVYLHEDSRLRIVHRDLKAGNILLDAEMNPKIADFGTAWLFDINQTQENTPHLAGTFGYMAPEYVKRGRFSVKSDVFSFGVLVLETISGQKRRSFSNGEGEDDLLTSAWESWNLGLGLDLVDLHLRDYSTSEMMRCIQIALLCVQENEADRPSMGTVVLMLSTESLPLATPKKPGYFMQRLRSESIKGSTNGVTISDIYPR